MTTQTTDLERLAALVAQRLDASRAAEVEKLLSMILEVKEDLDQIKSGKLPSRPSAADGWVVIKVAAHRSGYSPESVRQWCVSGEVQAKRHCGRWYVRLSSVLDRARRPPGNLGQLPAAEAG